MTPIAPGQVWRDNLAQCPVTVTEVHAPAAATLDRSVAVAYPNGHTAIYAGGYFDQTGGLGFTFVAATTDQRIGGST